MTELCDLISNKVAEGVLSSFFYIGTLKEIDIGSVCEPFGELTHTHDSIL